MSNKDVRRPAQQPNDRDFARQAALHSFDSVMHGLRSILHSLKPYQDQAILAASANGEVKPTREMFLAALASELLGACHGSLKDAGFIGAPEPPK